MRKFFFAYMLHLLFLHANSEKATATVPIEENLFFSKQKIYYYLENNSIKKTDKEVLSNYHLLFKRHNIDSLTNITNSSDNILWLRFTLDTILNDHYILRFVPHYKKITFYSFKSDSSIVMQTTGSAVPLDLRDFPGNNFYIELPNNTLNSYFIKYEFHDDFTVAAFEITTHSQMAKENLKNFIYYTFLFTLLLLIFIISIFYYFFNNQLRNLYYALYVLFFGVYAAASFSLWHLISHYITFPHTIFTYYIPFSLSTCFFALYVIKSIDFNKNSIAAKALYILIFIKLVSLFTPFFEVKDDSYLIYYFTKSDMIIFFLLSYLVIIDAIKARNLFSYWLVIGVLTLSIAQAIHTIQAPIFIFSFMSFEILWFGIGLGIQLKRNKEEKILALNEVINFKTNYNQELEATVQQRTMQLTQRGKELDKNFSIIAELNKILDDNNIKLKKNVETLEHDRILNKEISLDEFKTEFPDKESCIKLLNEIKWKDGFICTACQHTDYFEITKNDSVQRKCKTCGKIHSSTANTLFHNIKFSLEKAFYITFLATSHKKYSIDYISETIALRSGTVWAFKNKVEAAMEEKKFSKHKDMTWQDLIV